MSYDPERITFFAKTDARGKNVPFGIKAEDRTRHIYVIGKTGMGKSTLLENMAVQDIKNGEGFAFIDPHGQTAETLLEYIPEERMKDVLYFAPHDMQYPVSFNVMEDVGEDKRHLVVSGLMSVFEKIWVDAWSARMAYILQNTLMALLEYPGATLLGVNQMLSNPIYRQKVIDNIKDPAVKSFWVDEFLNYNERYMQEAGDAIKNKIGQFTSNPVIRNIIGQPKSSFNIREIMDERKILIMNLSKGLIGESNANLLGSMLTTRIYLAAMSRADLSPQEMKQMPNFYFYVDEFQSFANATFANILSEARKYKLNLTIAHQYIEQMEEEVKAAVFGNVGTTISFRVGPFDAEVLETLFAPKFYAVDICNLGFAQIYLTLMIDGIGSQPFSAQTLPPIERDGPSNRDQIIAASREQFSRPRAEISEAIDNWHKELEVMMAESKKKKNDKKRPPGNNNNGGNNQSPNNRGNGFSTSDNNSTERRPNNYQGTAPVNRSEERPGNNFNGERRERNNDDRERPRTNDRNFESKPVKEKSLDELRSVLSDLSKKETKPAPKKTEKPAKREVEKKSASEPGADLKAALAGALKAQAESTPQKAASPAPEAEAPVEKPTDKPAEKASMEPKGRDDNLNPKKLEKMMRVNTSDKTPLK